MMRRGFTVKPPWDIPDVEPIHRLGDLDIHLRLLELMIRAVWRAIGVLLV